MARERRERGLAPSVSSLDGKELEKRNGHAVRSMPSDQVALKTFFHSSSLNGLISFQRLIQLLTRLKCVRFFLHEIFIESLWRWKFHSGST